MGTDLASVIDGHCANCGTPVVGAYCHDCGQKAGATRLTLSHLLHEIPHAVFHVDRGFFATLIGLARRPGTTINGYLDGQRARFFNPLTMLVVTAGLNALVYSSLPIELPVPNRGIPPEFGQTYTEFLKLYFKYYTASMVLYLPLTALISRICFAGQGRSYGEHLVLNAFIMSFINLITLVFAPFMAMKSAPEVRFVTWLISAAVFVLYQTFAWFAVFSRPGRIFVTALRALGGQLLSIVVLTVVPSLIFLLFYMSR